MKWFMQVIGSKVGFHLIGNNTFQYFRQKGDVGQIVSGFSPSCLRMDIIAASLRFWGTELELKQGDHDDDDDVTDKSINDRETVIYKHGWNEVELCMRDMSLDNSTGVAGEN